MNFSKLHNPLFLIILNWVIWVIHFGCRLNDPFGQMHVTILWYSNKIVIIAALMNCLTSDSPFQVLFELARFHAPSTIFMDELESIIGQRTGFGAPG